VPSALKAFLLSVAIFDDLGAIIVIALFYTAGLSLLSLAVAAVLVLGLAGLNRAGVTRPAAYLLLGVPLWVAVLKFGVHATLAGVAVAMFIPLRARRRPPSAPAPEPLLRRLEHALHPVPLGIAGGLFLGKQIGVLAMSGLAVRLGLASRPDGVGWRQLHGTALLCGVGFTMSLFIASLAFEQGGPAYSGLERLGILGGSLVSGLVGYVVLRTSLSPAPNGVAPARPTPETRMTR